MNFFEGLYRLPGTIFSGITGFFLGGFKKKPDGTIREKIVGYEEGTDTYGRATKIPVTEELTTPNIIERILRIPRNLGNFIDNHKTAIATAFWASLILATAAVVTLFLLPEVLAVVTGFSIAGLSIAALVGTGLIPQLAAVAVVATAATSAAVYLGATVVNGINALIDLCCGSTAQAPAGGAQNRLQGYGASTRALHNLSAPQDQRQYGEVKQYPPVLQPQAQAQAVQDLSDEEEETLLDSNSPRN